MEDLLEWLLFEAADSARRAAGKLKRRPPKRGLTLQPGPDTPLWNELVRQVPEGAYVTGIKQTDQVIAMQGIAQSNERVSELLRNLTDNTPWLSKPELVDIVAKNIALSSKEQRRVSEFNLRFRLMRTGEVKGKDGAASEAGK